jgi:hypothetical protein
VKFLRLILVLYAFLCLFGAIGLFVTQKSIGFFVLEVYFLVNAIVIFTGTLFERRYKSSNKLKAGSKSTGERFIDPKSGKTVEVHFNPKTGERSYVNSETTSRAKS